MEARNRALPDWFTRLRTHQLVLPRFQRFEAWNYSQITALIAQLIERPSIAQVELDKAA